MTSVRFTATVNACPTPDRCAKAGECLDKEWCWKVAEVAERVRREGYVELRKLVEDD